MILKAFSIFDNKALQYHPPYFASTDGQAVRSFSDLVSDSNTNVGRHPNDYALFLIGHYDDQTGRFAEVFPVVHVVDAAALVPKVNSSFPFEMPPKE